MSPEARLSKVDWRVYLVADPGALAPGRAYMDAVERALDGGVGVVQLRDKSATARELVERARALRALCGRAGALFIVNDRVDVALAAGAHGVHVGPHDVQVEDVRRMSPELIVGASAGEVDVARGLEREGAHYLGVGALFEARQTKPDASAPRGVARMEHVRAAVGLPLVGIGGITAEVAREVFAAGADGVAVVRAVMGAEDPAEAAAALKSCAIRGVRT